MSRVKAGVKGFIPVPLEERFWDKVDRGDPDHCWLWVGAINRGGYGNIEVDGRIRSAYRVAYEMLVGPVPAGLELDHLCRVRACVNPKHLQPVPHRENVLRGSSPAARHAKKTTCPLGHPFDTTGSRGERRCRECSRDAARRFRIRQGIASAEDVSFHERFDALAQRARTLRKRQPIGEVS